MPGSDRAFYRSSMNGESATVWAEGDIDLVESDKLERLLVDLVGGGARQILVDLAGVTFMGSAALNALVVARNRLVEVGGQISLRAPSKTVRRVLEMTGLDQVLPIIE